MRIFSVVYCLQLTHIHLIIFICDFWFVVLCYAYCQPGLGIEWNSDKRLQMSTLRTILHWLQRRIVYHVSNRAQCKTRLQLLQEKKKVVRINQESDFQPNYIGQTELEYVDQFTYLGSVIYKDGDIEKDVSTRLRKAESVFRTLNIWKSTSFRQLIKLQVYEAVML